MQRQADGYNCGVFVMLLARLHVVAGAVFENEREAAGRADTGNGGQAARTGKGACTR